MQGLRGLLREKFGFSEFRLSQEQVCQAVASGEDVLLVMPTGAGKSLCYQLPGLARGGTTLVISPLLALIDDQVAKLKAMGLRAEQIHSGRSREDSRGACFKYLQGELDFLFIAPERLAVAGFPEMLRKRQPTLIAIDEAHCISQWGHDFRPEYRKLGERLAGLRPAPIIALTATATPLVQDDIVRQLSIPRAKRFIQGFRRTNIAIRAYEVPPSSRARACLTLLEGAGKTPAIIYVQTRKASEEIASELKTRFQAESYHAGMKSEARDDVQTRFLSGDFDVIVATVAFGMGIDKADIRTVIHAGMPGSVEGYYQEIGRAGRDGKPSSALLMHSFADQKTHEFFMDRDYPESKELQKVFEATDANPRPKDDVRKRAGKMDADTFETALGKLWIHGGVQVTPDEDVSIGSAGWVKTYEAQRNHRQQSIQQMGAFIRSADCRMLFFLKHFGDTDDKLGSCGSCDFCSGASDVSDTRPLTDEERTAVVQILAELSGSSAISAGRLFDEVAGSNRDFSRKKFEGLLDLLARAKWIAIRQETFEKDGKTIAYRKIEATAKGESVRAADISELRTSSAAWANEEGKPKKNQKKSKKKTILRPARSDDDLPATGATANPATIDRLKSWRLAKARQQGIPAFRIFGDRVLEALAEFRPGSLDELLEVRGMGPKLLDKYGSELLECLKGQLKR